MFHLSSIEHNIINIRASRYRQISKFTTWYKIYNTSSKKISSEINIPFKKGRSPIESLAIIAATKFTPNYSKKEVFKFNQRFNTLYWKACLNDQVFKKMTSMSASALYKYCGDFVFGKPASRKVGQRLMNIKIGCFVVDILDSKKLFTALLDDDNLLNEVSRVTVEEKCFLSPMPGGVSIMLQSKDYRKNRSGSNGSHYMLTTGKYRGQNIVLIDCHRIIKHQSTRSAKLLNNTHRHELSHLLFDSYYFPSTYKYPTYHNFTKLGRNIKLHEKQALWFFSDTALQVTTELIASLNNDDFPKPARGFNINAHRDQLRRLQKLIWIQHWSPATKKNIYTLYQQAYQQILRLYPRYQAILLKSLLYSKKHPKKLSLSKLEAVCLAITLDRVAELELWYRENIDPSYKYDDQLNYFINTIELKNQTLRQYLKTHHIKKARKHFDAFDNIIDFKLLLNLSAFHSPRYIDILLDTMKLCNNSYRIKFIIYALEITLEAWGTELDKAQLRRLAKVLKTMPTKLKSCYWTELDNQEILLKSFQLYNMVKLLIYHDGVDFIHYPSPEIIIHKTVKKYSRSLNTFYSNQHLQQLSKIIPRYDLIAWNTIIDKADIYHCKDVETLLTIVRRCQEPYIGYLILDQIYWLIDNKKIKPMQLNMVRKFIDQLSSQEKSIPREWVKKAKNIKKTLPKLN